jgi:fermentation-respiration switch protein FrsA (DUF1100 family)
MLLSVLYLACAPRFNANLYESLIFHPDKLQYSEAPIVHGIKGESTYFRSANGQLLNGWYFNNPSAQCTVLFNHGNGGNIADQTDLLELIAKAGASVFIYDYEGYGASTGTPSLAAMCDDAVGAYRYLSTTRGVHKQSIVLYGESLGAAVAAYLSTKFDCRGLILQSGFSSLRRIACDEFPILNLYPRWLFPTPEFNTVAVVSSPHPPLLLMHGTQDEVIPYQHAIDLFGRAIGQKRLVSLSRSGHENIARTDGVLYTNAVHWFLLSLSKA